MLVCFGVGRLQSARLRPQIVCFAAILQQVENQVEGWRGQRATGAELIDKCGPALDLLFWVGFFEIVIPAPQGTERLLNAAGSPLTSPKDVRVSCGCQRHSQRKGAHAHVSWSRARRMPSIRSLACETKKDVFGALFPPAMCLRLLLTPPSAEIEPLSISRWC